MPPKAISLICVDDNGLIADALKRRIGREPDLIWQGWLQSGPQLVEQLQRSPPDVVLLDIDIPGQDSFALLKMVSERFPSVRVVIFSGHVRSDYVDRAVDAGAWGYVSKNDNPGCLLRAVREAARGVFAVSPDVSQHPHRSGDALAQSRSDHRPN